MLTRSDHERVTAAIAEVERKTSGEIFCVLAQEVSRYREVPLTWAVID
jgi:putative membrane protein